MSRYEAWFALQKSVVDNGTAVAKVVLEGPDATPFATWPIGHRDLEASCDGMLESLRESLPKGRHQCRLVSFDSSGAQLSALPVVVVGASDAATEAAHGRVTQERANALFLGNAEKQLATTMRVIESAGEVIQAQNEAIANLKRDQQRFVELVDERLQKAARETAREQRLDALTARLAPLFEMGVSVLGAYVGEWFEKREAERANPKPPPGVQKTPAAPTIPPSPAAPALQSLREPRTETPSQEPSRQCVTVCDSSSDRSDGAGGGRPKRDRGGAAARGGDSRRGEDSERASPAAKTSARKRREGRLK